MNTEINLDDILRVPNEVIETLSKLKVDDAQSLINTIVSTDEDLKHIIKEIDNVQNLITKLTKQVECLEIQGKDADLWKSDLNIMKESEESLQNTKNELETLLEETLQKVNNYLKNY